MKRESTPGSTYRHTHSALIPPPPPPPSVPAPLQQGSPEDEGIISRAVAHIISYTQEAGPAFSFRSDCAQCRPQPCRELLAPSACSWGLGLQPLFVSLTRAQISACTLCPLPGGEGLHRMCTP